MACTIDAPSPVNDSVSTSRYIIVAVVNELRKPSFQQ
jgi:hypothetical protein